MKPESPSYYRRLYFVYYEPDRRDDYIQKETIMINDRVSAALLYRIVQIDLWLHCSSRGTQAKLCFSGARRGVEADLGL